MRRALPIVLLVLLACGESGTPQAATTAPPEPSPEIIVITASTDLAVGQERLLLALAAPDGSRLGSPDLATTVTLWPEEDPAAKVEVAGQWIWAVPDRSGLYRVPVEFDRAGIWVVQMTPASGPQPGAVGVIVKQDPNTPSVGSQAPRSVTPTAADAAEIAVISTDTSPEPRMYEMSVADAVASGRPTVIAFATPKFCQTAICGPTLDAVKELMPDYPRANFVHVEVYDLAASPADAVSIDQLVLAPSVIEWGLTSEPWVFVVDESGMVVGRFEGVVDAEEITALLG
ncbi:MAG: hypothetical protein OES13_06315 [Acidimicrobiia bacterium]|nr:hypothetical protein [Acidimicrobiia bacterium]